MSTTKDEWPWPTWQVSGLLVLLATLIRVFLVLSFPQHITGTDADQYIILGQNLAAGNGFSIWRFPPFDPDVFRSPGYPLFLAAFFRLGLGFWSIALCQVILEMSSLFFATAVLSKIVGKKSARVGLAVALLSPYTGAIPCLIFSESLSVPLITMLFAWGLQLRTKKNIIFYGAALGYLTLVRGSFLPGIILASLVLFIRYGLETKSWKKSVCATLGIVVAFAIVLAPYALWNKTHHGKISPTPLAGLGRAFAAGNSGIGLTTPNVTGEHWRVTQKLWDQIPGESHPTPEHIIQTEKEMVAESIATIKSNWGQYLAGVLRNEIHIWFGVRVLFPFHNPVGYGFLLRWCSIFILFMAGVSCWKLRSHWADLIIALTPVITLALVSPWLYVIMRYTTLAFAPLQLLCGAGICLLLKNPQERLPDPRN